METQGGGTVGDVRYKIVDGTGTAPTLPTDFDGDHIVAGSGNETRRTVAYQLTEGTSYKIYFAWLKTGSDWATAANANEIDATTNAFIPPGVSSIRVDEIGTTDIVAGNSGTRRYRMTFTNFTKNVNVSAGPAAALSLAQTPTAVGVTWTTAAVTLTGGTADARIFGGEAVLTAAADGSAVTATSSAVTVSAGGVTSNTFTFTISARPALTGFTVEGSGGANYITLPGSLALSATPVPVTADGGTKTWSSSNTNVATVNEATGNVTGVYPGVATITVRNGAVSKSFTVYVSDGDKFVTEQTHTPVYGTPDYADYEINYAGLTANTDYRITLGGSSTAIEGVSLSTTMSTASTNSKEVTLKADAVSGTWPVYAITDATAKARLRAAITLTIQKADGTGTTTTLYPRNGLTINGRVPTKEDFTVTGPFANGAFTGVYTGSAQKATVTWKANNAAGYGGAISVVYGNDDATTTYAGGITDVGSIGVYVIVTAAGGNFAATNAGNAVNLEKTIKVTKATPTVTWPMLSTVEFNPEKTKLGDYATLTTANPANHVAQNGSSTTPGGMFEWGDTEKQITAVTSGAAGNKYQMVYTPANTNNFKKVYSSGTVVNPEDEAVQSGGDVTFKVVQRKLTADDVNVPTWSSLNRAPSTDKTQIGITGWYDSSSIVYTGLTASAKKDFSWKDGRGQTLTNTLKTKYWGTITYGAEAYGTETSPKDDPPVHVGTYQVGVQVAAGGNYEAYTLTDPTWKIRIEPKKIKVEKGNHTKVYDAKTAIDDLDKVELLFKKGSASLDGSGDADYTYVGADVPKAVVTNAAYSTADAKELNIILATGGAEMAQSKISQNYTLGNGGDLTFDVSNSKRFTMDPKKGTGTTAVANGITKKQISIATDGHEIRSKVYNGDSLVFNYGTVLTTLAAADIKLAFNGLEGTDELVVGTDYTVTTAPSYANKNVEDGKLVTSGKISIKTDGTKGKNYAFKAVADSSFAGKGIKGGITPKTLENGFVQFSADVTANGVPYTGSEIVLTTTGTKAQLVVTDKVSNYGKSAAEIISASDYTVEYEENVNAGTGTAKVIVTAVDGGNYTTATQIEKPFNITKKRLTIATTAASHSVADKYYDGLAAAPVTKIGFVGLAPNDVLTLTSDDNPEGDYSISGAAYANADASDAAKKVTAGTVTLESGSAIAQNYTLASGIITTSMNIQGMVYKMPLAVSTVTTDGGRVYNGSDSVAITDITLVPVTDPDNPVSIARGTTNGWSIVAAKYADANVGVDKQIATGTVKLNGTAAKNYEVSDPNLGGFGSDVITKRDLSINTTASGTKVNKDYDGTADFTVENVAIKWTNLVKADSTTEGFIVTNGTFDTSSVGSRTVTSGTIELTGLLEENYNLTDGNLVGVKGTISKRKIPFQGVSATKVYDGKTTATGVEFSFNPADYDLWSGDIADQINPITWVYTSRDAGTKTVKPSGLPTFKTSAPETLRNFYTFTNDPVAVEGGITKKPLAFTSVSHTKPYDGTTTAKITSITWAASTAANGLVSGDAAATVVVDSVVADYTSAAPGTKDIIIKSVALKGTNGGNYDVIIPDTAIQVAGGITQAPIAITGVVIEKTYDGTADVNVPVKVLFSGIAATDTPFVDYEVANVKLSSKDAGTRTVSAGTVTLFGDALDNYQFPAASGNLGGRGFTTVVKQKTLKILAAEHNKKYDGNTTARGVKVTPDESGLEGTDTAAVADSVTAAYTSAMFGTKTLKITRVTYKGGNYISDSTTVTLAEGGILGTSVDSIKVTSANSVDSINGRRTLQLTAQVFPDSASIKAVKWSVSDTSLASINAAGLLTSKKNGTVVVTASAQDSSGKKGTFSLRIGGIPVSVAEVEREIPTQIVISDAAVAPVKAAVAKFTAGPSPAKVGSSIKFFSGSAVKSGSLYIFDASGNAVAKVSAKAGSGEIGGWDLKGKNGAVVSEGTYIVKGALTGKDGTREKVSFVFSVVK
ncbi:hypothetical protein R80B4_01926 [Fibrobacteres bacterium R8-0-B4]